MLKSPSFSSTLVTLAGRHLSSLLHIRPDYEVPPGSLCFSKVKTFLETPGSLSWKPCRVCLFLSSWRFFFPFSSQRCPLPTDMRRGPDTRFLFCPVLKIFFWLWKWPTLEQSRKVLACLSNTLVIKASRFFSTLVERKKNTWDSESLGPLTSHFLNVSQPHSLTDSPPNPLPPSFLYTSATRHTVYQEPGLTASRLTQLSPCFSSSLPDSQPLV